MIKTLRRSLLAVVGAAWLLAPVAADAQTCPTFRRGLVLTAAQWQSCFDLKQNVIAFTPVNRAGDTMQGPLTTAASGTAGAGFAILPGIAPSVPSNGDIWTTTAGIFVRINGATVGPLAPSSSAGFAATSPMAVAFPAGVVTYSITGAAGRVLAGAGPAFTPTPVLGVAGSVVGTLGFQNATSGTITLSPPTGALGTVTLTLPAAADTLVGKATTDTLTNKTLTAPAITSPVITTLFTATGLVKNADLVSPTITVNGTTCTLGSTCAPSATATSMTVGTTTVASGTTNNLLYNNGGVLGNGTIASFLTAGTGIALTGTTNATIALTAARQTLPTFQKFLSGSGTYTTPANVLWIEVEMIGGGGGGAGGGTGSPGAGGDGGATTWSGGSLSANGGGGAPSTLGGTGGGVVGTVNVSFPGGSGDGGRVSTAGVLNGYGGIGGSGFFGGAASQNLGTALNSGAGGAGGLASAVVDNLSGGGGGSGGYIRHRIGSPTATYTYAVGAAGTAGTAGTNGGAGTAGAAGIIMVREHYGSWLLLLFGWRRGRPANDNRNADRKAA